MIVSLGDPCGIGPEVVTGAWTAVKDQSDLAFGVIGDAGVLEAQGVTVARIGDLSEASEAFSTALPVLDRPLSVPAIPGQPDVAHAPHIVAWIREGVELCRDGQARALVTAPIAKAVLYGAGFDFPGHTEYLAHLCAKNGVEPLPVMMLAAGARLGKVAATFPLKTATTQKDLRVVLATIHTPLARVAGALSTDHLVRIAEITHAALARDFAIAAPRLVMAGLNPHAGEDGKIGREEVDILNPAIARLRGEGIAIHGPYPADTLFHDEARAGYDAAICMYHDQGLIPLKTLDFWGGVNITLGLPIVRTSPDHGTGFDIAGKGVARTDSFVNALHAADTISRNRAR